MNDELTPTPDNSATIPQPISSPETAPLPVAEPSGEPAAPMSIDAVTTSGSPEPAVATVTEPTAAAETAAAETAASATAASATATAVASEATAADSPASEATAADSPASESTASESTASDSAASESAAATAFEAGSRPKVTTFEEIDLSRAMRRSLKLAGYQRPTDIQAGVIPLVLDGFDVLGQARTGTGKTASFVIPILEMLSPPGKVRGVQAIILVPTRELAVQVHDEVIKLSVGMKVRCVAVYGGKPIRGQIDKLQRGAEIVVGTPGRVLDHLSRGTLTLHDVWCVVLDEADRMLDIGFRPDIEKILRRCPRDRQTLLLSATVPPPIRRLAERYMYHPEVLNFSPKNLSVDTIDQYYFSVEPDRKFDLLLKLLDREQPRQAIIFCRTKRGTDRIGERLAKRVPQVACMHGDMTQGARDSVMRRFRDGELRLLVATDVVGRGIDISGISHIINFDIPAFSDDYVHRVGRTGRMGREGVAFTFVAPDEGLELTKIEQRIDRLLKRDTMVGFEPPKARGPAPRPQPAPTIGSWDASASASPASRSREKFGESPAAISEPAELAAEREDSPSASDSSQPASQPASQSDTQPASQSDSQPASQPAGQTAGQPAFHSASQPAVEPLGDSALVTSPDAAGTLAGTSAGTSAETSAGTFGQPLAEPAGEAPVSTFGQPNHGKNPAGSNPPGTTPPKKPSKRYRRAL
jgi:ATP-dependent RNA helicase DeaD